MEVSELDGGGDWTIPPSRYKTNKPHLVPLSAAVRKVLEKLPIVGEGRFVFSTNGQTPFSGFSKAKADLNRSMLKHLRKIAEDRDDKRLIAQTTAVALLKGKAAKGDKSAREQFRQCWWRLHDLRRTGKTLMIRTGVRPDISERVLGHAIIPQMQGRAGPGGLLVSETDTVPAGQG